MSMNTFQKSKEGQGQGRRKGGKFDSVPADDGFRNYMANKIALQRKQFGLIVPPPPPPSPPPKLLQTPISKKAARPKHSDDNGNDDILAPKVPDFIWSNTSRSETKSVRFRPTSEAGGLSQMLENLKQRHALGERRGMRSSSTRKRRRKSRSLALDAYEGSVPDATREKHRTDTSTAESGHDPSNSYSISVLGVLDNLQKRYGTSVSKTSKGRHRNRSGGVKSPSVPKSLEFGEKNSPVASSFRSTPKGSNHGAGTAPSKKMRGNPRLQERSIAEGSGPEIHDMMSGQDEANDPPTKQQHTQEQLRHNSKGTPESREPALYQLTQHSPLGDFPSPPRTDLRDRALAQNLVCRGLKSRSESNPATSRTDNFPFLSTPAPIDLTRVSPSPASDATTPLSRKPSHRPDLFFTGIVILVNGHTSPDATTLMRLLHKHGGDLEKYETRRITHVIAEQLSTAKANGYKRQKNPTPVCRPEWIADSVERGKLLPFGDYLLDDVRNDGGTKSVKSFFKPTPDLANECLTHGNDNPLPRESPGEGNGTTENESLSNLSTSHRWQDTKPSEATYHLNGQRHVGNDPHFLDSYFSNSRLSYIGSFKQRVKPPKSAASRSQPKAGTEKFVLLCDMDCFFAAVALKKYPQFRDRPVAVGHAHSAKANASENSITAKTYSKNSSSELSTCNYIAREHGIKKGMFLGDAIKRCPDLVVLPYDFRGFEEVSSIVAEQLHGFAEQYNGIVEQVSCDELYVEINVIPGDCPGNDIYGFLNSLAEHIRADIVKKTECTASIGIGANKLLAKLAADKVKPNACCVVNNWREFLGDLNLRDIPGIGRKLEKKLQPLCSVKDIWDLEDDAERVLGKIIGSGTARKIIQHCYGKDDRVVTPAIRKSIGAECNYGVRFEGPYGVNYMIQGLAKEVQKRMTGVGVRGAKLVFKVMKSKDKSKVPGKFLGHGLCDSFSRSVEIPLTRDKDVISSAAAKLYDRLGIDKSSIRGMGIVIMSLNSDEEVPPLNSSPSKLCAWLKKDNDSSPAMPTNSESQEVFEGEIETSNNVAFAIENAGTHETTMPERDSSVMPSFSQLDQDVLHNLPEEILSEVKAMYGKKQHIQNNSQQSLRLPLRKHVIRGGKTVKPITIAGQTSVRRMLKLACIKSGEDQLHENNVSLTQLDCLPLEVQLQIANEDHIEIAKRTKVKTNNANSSRSLSFIQDDPIDVEVMPSQTSQIEAQECVSQDNSTTNFYQENISPLRDFISSNPTPDGEMIETVKDFLSLWINERRIGDTITFLRTIKNMENGWDNAIYLQVRESAVHKIHSTTGSLLDIRWLGL